MTPYFVGLAPTKLGVLRSIAMSYLQKPVWGSLLLVLMSTGAMAAPGEDPIVLTKPTEHLLLPMANNAAPGRLDSTAGIPSNVKAKITRLEAKSFSSNTDGMYTDADVTSTVTTGQQKKTCVQDVGSNTNTTGAMRFGPGNKPQIVVLRGDLVNICN